MTNSAKTKAELQKENAALRAKISELNARLDNLEQTQFQKSLANDPRNKHVADLERVREEYGYMNDPMHPRKII